MEISSIIRKKIKNNSELFLNILGSVGIKGLSMLIGILTLPAYLHYFKDQQILGVWFALLSILNWVLTFDLGIGNGLRNYLVEAFVEKDETKAKRYISSAYITIGSITILLGLIGYLIIGESNWNSILNISKNVIDNNILIGVVRLIYTGILLQLFLRLILSILYALQKPALSYFILLISNSLILVFLVIYKSNDVITNLQTLARVYMVIINVPLFIATIIVFAKPLKNSRPNITFYNKDYSKKILKLGSMFLGIQLSLLIINSTNEILIIQLFGPEEVVLYQAYYKIFSTPLVFFSIITIPIWSSVTKAFIENRIDWIKKIYKYLNIIALTICIFSIALVFVFQNIVDIWLGSEAFQVELFSATIFALYNSIMIFIYSVTSIANGISKLKPQLICNIIAALLKIPLAIILSKMIDSWISIIIVNIIIMVPSIIIQPLAIRKEFKKIQMLDSTSDMAARSIEL